MVERGLRPVPQCGVEWIGAEQGGQPALRSRTFPAAGGFLCLDWFSGCLEPKPCCGAPFRPSPSRILLQGPGWLLLGPQLSLGGA